MSRWGYEIVKNSSAETIIMVYERSGYRKAGERIQPFQRYNSNKHTNRQKEKNKSLKNSLGSRSYQLLI